MQSASLRITCFYHFHILFLLHVTSTNQSGNVLNPRTHRCSDTEIILNECVIHTVLIFSRTKDIEFNTRLNSVYSDVVSDVFNT